MTNKYKPSFLKNRKLFFFAQYLLIIFILISCNSKTPVITSINPKIGQIGEIITLNGSNFGSSRDEAYVTIAGVAPTNSSYFLWQDNMIIIKVPELGESGLVYVHANGKKSNGVLFSNSAVVPKPIEGEELGLQPRITSVNPASSAPGSLIIINGNNFGMSRENSLQSMLSRGSLETHITGVFFSWDYDSGPINPYMVREPEFIEVSEIEIGYEAWSAREIRVRLPDGAVSGNVEVRTAHGRSRPVFFEVSGKPGVKILKEKRSYIVTYSVDIRVHDATKPNTLYLWIPFPINSSSQRNVSLISRNVDPFIENHHNVSLFKMDNLTAGINQSVSHSFQVEVYTVETEIRPLAVRQDNNAQTRSALYAMHTQSSDLIPSDDQIIKTAVNSIIGREQNPYLKAKLIYDWIIKNIEINDALYYNTNTDNTSLHAVLSTRQSDHYSAVRLFTSMARAAGVPCIPIGGVLIDKGGQTFQHHWAEFWIDAFGWLPVDPAMGAGAITLDSFHEPIVLHEETNNNKDLASYYFGNIDNMRIAFSRGEHVLSQIENRGRLVSHTQSYSIQNIWEEASGGLESYSSLWGDIIISGVYVH
ncbi:MAG: IPT/TIG domain-containing protein [Treponema sp.]|nr:IPT/TIG domain-containing protein [Treponema sp.]MCL2252254.1 IPT/TIG domain-containing protein [Treponema sp.]